MKTILGLALLAALYYGHGLYVFGETHLNAWFAESNEAAVKAKRTSVTTSAPTCSSTSLRKMPRATS